MKMSRLKIVIYVPSTGNFLLTGAFDLLVYTNQSADVPEKWAESAPCFISNSQEVPLKSFSTSVHKVDGCVSYKVVDA